MGLVSFVIYELSIKNPAVNLKVLGNRNLVHNIIHFCCRLWIIHIGLCLPGACATRTFSYTAYETGLSLLPPTLMGVIMMPIIGKTLSKGTPALRLLLLALVSLHYMP